MSEYFSTTHINSSSHSASQILIHSCISSLFPSLINATLHYMTGECHGTWHVRWIWPHCCSHCAYSLIHKVVHLFTSLCPSGIYSGGHAPIFSVPQCLRFSLCMYFTLIFSPQTQLREKSICWPPLWRNRWVQGPTTCHASSFFSLPSLLLLMQRGWRIRPCFEMEQGCSMRVSRANWWKPLAQSSCLPLGWFERSFYPLWLTLNTHLLTPVSK